MKKLMVLAALVCTTIGAQAASVAWASFNGSSKTFLVDDSGTHMSADDFGSLGVNFVLVSLAGDDLAAYQKGTYSAAYDAGAVLSTGNISTSTKAAQKGSFTTTFKFTYGDTNPIKDGDYLAVVITDGKTMQNIEYANGTAVTDTLLVTGLAKDGNIYTDTFNFATKGNFTANIANIPEPTSGLLLVLGLAGLALRRKCA